jgi:hypothetical protein
MTIPNLASLTTLAEIETGRGRRVDVALDSERGGVFLTRRQLDEATGEWGYRGHMIIPRRQLAALVEAIERALAADNAT